MQYAETIAERARRRDPSSGRLYNRLAYACAIVVHAMRMAPHVVFRSVEAATNPDVARAELSEPPRDVSAECSEAEVAPAKRKRVRVRSPKLFVDDIVVGEYVPKRGNNKTPNFRVLSVKPLDVPCAYEVTFDRGEGTAPASMDRSDFLALVARRVDA